VAVFEPIHNRPQSLTEQVYDTIREAIVARRLAPGDRVSEASLATQLAVSKTPVREALLQLEYIGLIEPDGRRGGRIVTPSRESIKAAYEIRIGLEVQATRLVAERGDAADVAIARGHARTCLEFAQLGDRDGFRQFDRKFHFALATATGNALLVRFVRDAFDLTWALRRRDVPVASASQECARQHLHVLEAVDAGDVDRAEKAMRGHIQKVEGLVLDAFDQGSVDVEQTSAFSG
jgi:DNA-binding GntR family transcriptional regulator